MTSVGEDIVNALKALAGGATEAIVDAVAIWHTASEVTRTIASGVAAAAMQGEMNDVQARYQQTPLTPALLADAVIRNIMTQAAGAAEAAYSGIDPARFDLMVQDTGESYGIIDALRLWHQGSYLGGSYGITEDELKTVIYYSRVRDQFIPDLEKLSWHTMSDADAIGTVVKGRATVEQGQAWFAAAGGMPEQWDVLYQSSGDSIGVEKANELFQHGMISKAQLQAIIYQSRINPEFYDEAQLTWLKWLEAYQVADILKAGAIDGKTATTWMQEAGYPADQIAAFIVANSTAPTAATKQATVAIIMADYEAQLLTTAEATAALRDAGESPEAIPFILESYDARRIITQRNAAITKVRNGFVAGAITPDTAATELGKLGIGQAAITGYLVAWQVIAESEVRRLTEAQVGALYKTGKMSAQDAALRWGQMGYPAADVAYLLAHYEPATPAS